MQFSSEIQKFLDNYGGFEPDLNWEKRSKDRHKNICEFLGGETYKIEYKTEKSYEGLPQQEVDKIHDYLVRNCRSYLTQYKIRKEDLFKERIKSKKPNSNNSYKWTKHIPEFFKRNDIVPPIDLSNFISDLGEKHAMYKNKKITLYVTATASPIAFAMMGHMGADRDSCFKQTSANPHHKFVLGQTQDSFVVLISEKPIDLTYEGLANNDSILARLWGIYNKKSEKIIFCNYYPNPNGKLRNTTFGHIPNILKEIVGSEFEYKEVGPTLGVQNVYYNGRGNKHDINICFFKKNSWPQTQHSFICNTDNDMCTSKQTTCSKCSRRVHISSIFKDPILHSNICYKCIDKVKIKKSDLTGIESTSSDIILYIDDKGSLLKAFKSEVPDLPTVKHIVDIDKQDENKVKVTKYKYPITIKDLNKISMSYPNGRAVYIHCNDKVKSIKIKTKMNTKHKESEELFNIEEYEITKP